MSVKIKELILFLAILAGAFILRVWQYYYFPIGGETADESAWTLLGASLIQERVPASWSYFLPYEGYHYVEGVFDAPIVRPALDHPPLFSLLPGTAHSFKSFWLDSPSFKVIRLPMVILGTLNVGLFWWLVRRIFGRIEWVALATVLFATIPMLVFGSRLVVAENLLVTWIILSMLLVLGKPMKYTRLLLTVVGAAAVLTKVAGLIVPASLLIYGVLAKRTQITRAAIVSTLIGLALFAVYGAYYNWPLFVALISSQSARELGLATLQNRLFLNPVLVKHIFFDGWKVTGLLAAVFLIGQQLKDKKLLLAHSFTVSALLFIALAVGESTFHGWYDLVLWPSLVISLVGLFKHILETKNSLMLGLVWLFMLPTIRLALIFADQYGNLSNLMVRVIIVLGFIPFGWQWLRQPRLFKPTFWGLLFVLLACNVITIFMVSHEAYWLQAAFFELPQ